MRWLRYKLYRLKWWLAYYVNFAAPVHLDIEVNSSCNLRCPICHQSDEPRVYELKKLTADVVKARLKEARELGVLSFKPNWRGEALIHSDIWEILRYAIELDFVEILINTNLSVNLTPAQMQLLMHPSISLKVSIDSITNYVVARRGGDLGLVIKNMVTLSRLGKKLETNRHESEVTELWIDYREAFKRVFYDEWSNQSEHSYWRLHAEDAFFKIKMHNGTAQVRNHSVNMFVGNKAGQERVYCGMPSRRLLISGTTEKIYPCCVAYAEPADLSVGNKETSLMDAWNSERIKGFRKLLKENKMPTRTCINCVSSDAWR